MSNEAKCIVCDDSIIKSAGYCTADDGSLCCSYNCLYRRNTTHPVASTAEPAATAQEDPWKHRSKGMCCGTCMWGIMKEVEGGEAKIGRCRRHAPTMSGYPAIFPADWCGDHKLDENKI